jgi:hypothetical protein
VFLNFKIENKFRGVSTKILHVFSLAMQTHTLRAQVLQVFSLAMQVFSLAMQTHTLRAQVLQVFSLPMQVFSYALSVISFLLELFSNIQ